MTEGPLLSESYRDNPLLLEVDRLKNMLTVVNRDLDVWKTAFDAASKEHQQELKNMQDSQMGRFVSRALFWFVIIPLWLVMGVAAAVLPPYFFYVHHVSENVFWWEGLAAVLLIVLGNFLDGERDK